MDYIAIFLLIVMTAMIIRIPFTVMQAVIKAAKR